MILFSTGNAANGRTLEPGVSGEFLCSKAFWEAKEIGEPQNLVKSPRCVLKEKHDVSKQLEAHRFTVPLACYAWNSSL